MIRLYDNEIGTVLAALDCYKQQLNDLAFLEYVEGHTAEEEIERIDRIKLRIDAADALEAAGFTDEE